VYRSVHRSARILVRKQPARTIAGYALFECRALTVGVIPSIRPCMFYEYMQPEAERVTVVFLL
jgi:hypothetical protein